jgi:hypothetical protein
VRGSVAKIETVFTAISLDALIEKPAASKAICDPARQGRSQ